MKLHEFRRRIAFLLRRNKHLEDLDEEMRLHTDLRARALQEQGMTPESAVRASARRLGNRTSLQEAVWDLWSFAWLESVWLDLKFAVRVLRKQPGFTALAVLTLALGIGATTAMFSVIDNVLLEPFPYADQDRLFSVVIHDASANRSTGERTMFPATELLDYQEQSRIFEDVMGVAISRALWTTGGAPESVNAPLVTANAFSFLGVPPLLGRIPTPSDLRPEAAPVCLLSYGFWQSRFAADPHVIGTVLTLDGVPRTVIGVMPPRFVFWSGDVWLPTTLRRDPAGFPPPWYYLLGRLKAGVSLSAADHEIQLLAERLARRYRPHLYPARFDARLLSFADASVGKFRQALLTLLAAVGLLLLIACTNVVSLLLARASARTRELAIRGSLGAGWARVVRQLFVESAVLAGAGAVVGCAFAYGGLQVLVAVLPRDTFPEEAVIGLNGRVLAGTLAVAVSTALFFGLVPALSGLRRDVNEALKAGGREGSSFRHGQIRRVLIVCEVALSLVLLAGAGVTLRSFLRERAVPLGLNPHHLLTAQLFLNKGHRTVEQQARFAHELTDALRRVPGVLDAATTTDFPPFSGAATEFAVPGQTHSEQYDGQLALIDPGLFRVLQVPLLRGRSLTETDVAGKRMVTVVNQAFVEKFFRKEDPIGQRVQVTTLAYLPEPVRDPSCEIVGVVANFKNRGVRQSVVPEAFVPYTVSGLGGFSVLLRTSGLPGTLAKTLESAALTLDGSTVVRRLRTMEEGLENEEYAKPRFGLQIFSVFALLGLLLVSMGLYSIMSYTVSQQRREMGIRLALGASPQNVQAMVIAMGLRLVVLGILVGWLVSFLALRTLQSQIWDLQAQDPITLGAVAGILVFVGIVACYVPSRVAFQVDPALTLRSE